MSPEEPGFNAWDCRRLSQAAAQAVEARVFRRLQAVLLVAEGRSFDEAAQITGLSRRTVYYLVDRYLHGHQVSVLHDESRSGRPPVARSITKARILRQLQRSPLRLGYLTNVWTVELLAHHLSQRYGCPITPHTLRRRMKQIGLECKRPRYVYSEKDPHRAQKKGQLFGN
ncbi:MAG: helix-turn-helix domain-containing protein [Pyrinomonadaceae bacterium]|jgi:transposase|nr:helix-turn-helix domain-containing protein [Pyrinomonadaceae bacterium]